jgi:hypothetical protein
MPTSEAPCPTPFETCFGVAIYVDHVESYKVTAVERVINYLELNDLSGNWTIAASQSIRYWGEIIPEPHSVTMLVIGLAYICFSVRGRVDRVEALTEVACVGRVRSVTRARRR